MKRILIAGANSYIGSSFKRYLEQWSDVYRVDSISLRDDGWRTKSFSGYDAVLHAAAIVHQKETKENASFYEKVNCELALAVAQKAKDEGAGQFVFLSTMSVYGMDTGIITPDTLPKPRSLYGTSKLRAEKRLSALQSGDFCITVIRPPMVYGGNCKGNFQTVVKLVQKSPVFPKVNNQRSMIYIDTLCGFIKSLIDTVSSGVFCPQNQDYVNTTAMAACIAKCMGKRLFISGFLGACMKLLMCAGTVRKAFGSLVYQGFDNGGIAADGIEFEESIRRSCGSHV